MRLSICAAALALACALLAACGPRDTSGQAANSAAAAASPRTGVPNVAAAGGAAQQSPAEPAQAGDGVMRVTEQQLSEEMKRGTVALYDVRDKSSYEAGHIKGAKNVPWDEVEKRLAEFPKDKQIITYCA